MLLQLYLHTHIKILLIPISSSIYINENKTARNLSGEIFCTKNFLIYGTYKILAKGYILQVSQLPISCDFRGTSHIKDSAFCILYQYIIHEIYTHVYNATIQAKMSSEWLLTREENPYLQNWKCCTMMYHGKSYCFVTEGRGMGCEQKENNLV